MFQIQTKLPNNRTHTLPKKYETEEAARAAITSVSALMFPEGEARETFRNACKVIEKG